ncbi:hypothetical protein FQA39_LY16907 [Lamprigera yunnana]|nr:hypothetical protein FQA39_LY16907 [Lamprigera yunnana]
MAEERTITVTLESGGQNPSVPTLPVSQQTYAQGPHGYAPAQGNYPPPQAGYGPPPGAGFGTAPPGSNTAAVGFGAHPHAPPGNFDHGPPQGGYSTNGHNPNMPPPPIFNQPAIPGGPSNDNWMMRPQNIPNCPPGLEYLTTIDTLIVNQIFNITEAFGDREPENEFVITNNIGQKVYYAREESDDCSRQFCGSRRAFRMKIFDNFGNQVINLSRPIACQACCFPCCLQKLEVCAPPGTVVGRVEQEWAFLYPNFAIKNHAGDVVLRVQGPWCTMNCYADVDFKVLTPDGGNEVGKISKKWSGYQSENSAKMDVFRISFPLDLDVHMKAVMLGVCFLIDMMYFEQSVSETMEIVEKKTSIENIPLSVVCFSPQEMPIVNQPTAMGCKIKPETFGNCPAGLEYLDTLEELHIAHQNSHEYQYVVMNKQKEKFYQVQLAFTSKLCKAQSKYTIKMFDIFEKEIINVTHGFGCQSCLCCCFMQKLHVVSTSSNQQLGVLEQEWSLLYPTFAVKVQERNIVLRIEGPCCQLECCNNIDFKIITPDGSDEVGYISRKMNDGGAQNTTFVVRFPKELDVRVKSLLLTAGFLIDLIYFKSVPQ